MFLKTFYWPQNADNHYRRYSLMHNQAEQVKPTRSLLDRFVNRIFRRPYLADVPPPIYNRPFDRISYPTLYHTNTPLRLPLPSEPLGFQFGKPGRKSLLHRKYWNSITTENPFSVGKHSQHDFDEGDYNYEDHHFDDEFYDDHRNFYIDKIVSEYNKPFNGKPVAYTKQTPKVIEPNRNIEAYQSMQNYAYADRIKRPNEKNCASGSNVNYHYHLYVNNKLNATRKKPSKPPVAATTTENHNVIYVQKPSASEDYVYEVITRSSYVDDSVFMAIDEAKKNAKKKKADQFDSNFYNNLLMTKILKDTSDVILPVENYRANSSANNKFQYKASRNKVNNGRMFQKDNNTRLYYTLEPKPNKLPIK